MCDLYRRSELSLCLREKTQQELQSRKHTSTCTIGNKMFTWIKRREKKQQKVVVAALSFQSTVLKARLSPVLLVPGLAAQNISSGPLATSQTVWVTKPGTFITQLRSGPELHTGLQSISNICAGFVARDSLYETGAESSLHEKHVKTFNVVLWLPTCFPHQSHKVIILPVTYVCSRRQHPDQQ